MRLVKSQLASELERIRIDLQTYLGQRVTSVKKMRAGHSGFTYDVECATGSFVMRVPPPGARIAGPADVLRQGRIMGALNKAGLPVPAVPVICAEPLVDGRPFILMEAVSGVRIEQAITMVAPSDIARAAVEVLKLIQALPIAETGIGHEGPVGLDSEMVRWTWLMERAPDEFTVRSDALRRTLEDGWPPERMPTLVHGDYHFGNLLFRGSQIVGVLDWEIAEIGQPLLDLGCLAVGAKSETFRDGPHPGGGLDLPVAKLLEMYSVEPDEMRWYLALSYYKYAAIFGYNLMLHRRGKRVDPMYERLTKTIVRLIDDGLKLLA